MLKTIQIALDSLTKDEVDEYETVYLAIDDTGYELHLSPDSLQKLHEALEPFITGEDDSIPPRQHYGTKTTRSQQATSSASRAEREAIAAFVEQQGLGRVGPRGRIRRSFVEAWEEAGKPGL